MTTPLLIGGAIGAIGFVLVFLIDGATRPGYRPAYHPVSALSLGDRGWIQTTNFIVTGLLFLGAATALGFATDRGASSVVGAILIGIVAVGVVVSGVFAMDPMRGYPPGTGEGDPALSTHHKVHDAAGPVVFGVLPLACFAMTWSFASAPAEPGWALYSGVSGGALAVLVVLFARAWRRGDQYSGLIQRGYLVIGWAWLAAIFTSFAGRSG